ncbi:hypothetical protein, partial [Aeromonas allosaccharophila]
ALASWSPVIRFTWLPYPASRANGHGTRTSRDLDGLVRSCCWPGGTVEQLQELAASMAGGWPAGRRQCGSGVPGCPGRGTAAR